MDKRDRQLLRKGAMELERSYYFRHWMDLADNFAPRSARFFVTDKNQRNLRNTKIINGTPILAARALKAGLMSGITNPARPWFKYQTGNPDLDTIHHVKIYLEQLRQSVANILLKSNCYTVLPLVYEDMGVQGTSAFEILEDDEDMVRFYHWPIGSYTLGLSSKLKVDTAFRQVQMTVHQLVEQFGYDACSPSTRALYDSKSIDKQVTVYRMVSPNPDAKSGMLSAKYLPFTSDWWELGSDPDKYLRESGFNEMSVIAPRWQVTGEDTYGISAGMEALGDAAALQVQERKKAQLLEKHNNPPLNAPAKLSGSVTNLPGGVNFVDILQGQSGVTAAYQVQMDGYQHLLEDIHGMEDRINSFFYKDLFLMIADTKKDATAYEIAALQEEKLLGLGPVYLRLNDELLDAIHHRVLGILIRKSKPYWEGRLNGQPPLPPPPPEMMGAPIGIEYISIMAQAMKAVGITSIERSMTFAGGLGQSFPGVLDNIDSDKVIRHYFDINGTPPDMLKDEEDVAKIRAIAAQRQQAQESMAMAQQGADAANKMANAPLSDNNALSQLLSRMGAQPQPQGVQ